MNIRRVALTINGAERFVFCDPEKDTLAEVLRRVGLTGTKIGCNVGLCGACSVIFNGELIRSCVKKMKNVEDYSEITTIEGIGSPNYPHPLQLAWARFGGVQCGFCSPGFIVAAYALLKKNPDPSREEIREWFQKNNNVCRCTGYVPIVDSVIAAAKVMRGEAGIETLQYEEPADGEYYGTPVIRPVALAKACGVCDYGDDVALKMPAETLHLAIVQPRKYHHANIKSIDFSEAEKMPGVVKVLTAKDVPGTNLIGGRLNHPRGLVNGATWPVLNDKKIYRYGDVVAVVAADTRAHARAAAAAVKVDLEPLPEYLTYLEAAVPDAIEIHPGNPNIYLHQPLFHGELAKDVIAKSDYVVEGSYMSTREPHLNIEPDTMQAFYDETGKLTIACKTQDVYGTIDYIASALGLGGDDLRIIENPTGASFGAAVNPHSYAIAAMAEMNLKQPLTWTMSWEENQHFAGKRAPVWTNGRLACDKDGKITAMELDMGCDHGAYHDMAEYLNNRLVRMAGFPYNIPNCTGIFRTGYTNHQLATTYRGFGAPQCQTVSESLMDQLAEACGMDPFDFREKNIARPGDYTINGYPYREYPMPQIFEKARPVYEEMKKRAAAESTPEKKRGVGMAIGGFTCTGGNGDSATVYLEMKPDGSFVNYNTWEDQGQGGDAGTVTHTVTAFNKFGYKITTDKIKTVLNDSRDCPNSGMAAGSRCHYMIGNATIDAVKQMLDNMKKEDGTWRTYDEMVKDGKPLKVKGYHEVAGLGLVGLDPNDGTINVTPTFMYCLNIADVEVDTATGKATVKHYTIVDDIGAVGNEISVEGQAYGGIAHGIGFALQEDYHDVKKHGNIKGSGVNYPLDTPDDIQIIHCFTPRPTGPWGSSGCSEMYQSCQHMAVINAIYHACGVRIWELPALPAKIKAGLDALAKGEQPYKPEKYFLGGDMYDELEELKANPV